MHALLVTSKSQVTIPKVVRRRLGIRAGSRVRFALMDDHAELQVVHARAAVQISGAGHPHDLGEQRQNRLVLRQAVTVLAKGYVAPHDIVDAQADGAAKQHVVIELRDQLPLAANTVRRLQQMGATVALPQPGRGGALRKGWLIANKCA